MKTNRTNMIFMLFFLCIQMSIYAQNDVHLRGKVLDKNQNTIIGANVSILNSEIGTISEIDGSYELLARLKDGNYQLIISYLGFQSQKINFTVPGPNIVSNDIILVEDALQLDEVIVTGNSSTTKRKQLGNSIAVVKAENIGATSTNTLGALSGKVMGAQISQNSGDPGGGFSIKMRGTSSISGSSEPLYIVDGVIVDNSSQNVINLSADAMSAGINGGQNRLVDLNPADIERIEVLNGASAAAIYGSRAANGVVQIFTKRGENSKLKISYNSSYNYSKLRKKIFTTDYGKRFGIKGNDRLETTQDRLTLLLTLGLSEKYLTDNGINYVKAGDAKRLLITDQYDTKRYDYQDNIFGSAFGTDQNISLQGGNEKTKYFFSLGYSNNDGIIKNTNFTKYTSRIRVDQSINSWMSMSAGLSYTHSSSKDLPNGNNFFSPVSTMFIIDNTWDITERDALGNLKQVELVRVNPLSVIETFDITQKTHRVIGDLQIKLFPIKNVRADLIFGADHYNLIGNEYHPRLPYSGVAATFFPDGLVSYANSDVTLLNHDFNLNYDHKFSDRFHSNLAIGYQLQYNKNEFESQQGRDLAPFVRTISAASNLFSTPVQNISERFISGYYLQNTFAYDDELFVTIAGRVDGSSSFSKSNQFNFYPKASISYLLNRLLKLGNIDNTINSLKLRASYGEAGNLTAIGSYDRYSNYLLYTYGGLPAILPSTQLANPDVKPERKKEFEIGTDMALLSNKITISMSYYKQNIVDLLLFKPIAPSGGGTSVVSNLQGKMSNKGFEAMINYKLLDQTNFSWNIGFNFSTNKNKVSGIDGVLLLRGGDGTQAALNGEQFGVFFGRYYARDNNGGLLLTSGKLAQTERGFVIPQSQYNPNNLPSEALLDRAYLAGGSYYVPARNSEGQPLNTTAKNKDGKSFSPQELRKVLGDPNPDWIGSLTSQLRFKKLDLNIQFDVFNGAEIYNWNRITGNNVGFGDLAEKELKGEVPRGYVGSVAGGVTGSRIQEEHIESASYIKLREIGVNLNLGKLFQGMSDFKLGISGRNLVSFDNYQGFDPETNSAGQNDRVRGDDFGNSPIPLSLQLKINANF